MNSRIDEKGKVFTDFVHKDRLLIRMQVDSTLVQGIMHIRPGNRLKDELNNAEPFIAITHAKVFDGGSKDGWFETDVLIVNRQQIAWICPQEMTAPRDTHERDAALSSSAEDK